MKFSRSSEIEVSSWERACIEHAADILTDDYPLTAPYLKRLAERLKENEQGAEES